MIVNIGIIGFGTVGTGTVKILLKKRKLIEERTGIKLNLKKIADIDLERDRGIKLADGMLTNKVEELIEDPQIHIIVELIGGIKPAKDFILQAIKNGKHVVTANKALLATEGKDIFFEAIKRGVSIGFEAAVAGSIPIIKVMKECMVANEVFSIYGIINGTSNYILTRMTEDGMNFNDALKEAQKLGYAEADPTFDIEGIDTAHKLTILASLAFGIPLSYEKVYVEGISNITAQDIKFAQELGYKIKLLAIAKKVNDEIELRVHPTMIPKSYLISNVEGVLNAVYIVGDAVGESLYYGKGAGEMPTASAVVSDIVEIATKIINCSSISKEINYIGKKSSLKIKSANEIESMYYFRFSAIDRPGVLSKISGILGKYEISISSVIQKGRRIGEVVPLVILTHKAKELDVQKALKAIEKLDVVRGKNIMIRVENAEF